MNSRGVRVHQDLEKRKGWTKLGRTGQDPRGPRSLEWGECETRPQEEVFGKDVVKREHRGHC